jgi:hypothetical protein
MRKLYIAAILGLGAFSSFAQQVKPYHEFGRPIKSFAEPVQKFSNNFNHSNTRSVKDTIFYENFANGFIGLGDNGEWTAIDDQGFCNWQYTSQGPQGQYSAKTPISSPSGTNGFMILDGDFCNADNGSSNVGAYLVSPIIDLSEQPKVEIQFYHNFRFCCSNANAIFELQVSNNNGLTWTPFDVRDGITANNESANPLIKTVNISAVAGGKSNVQFRFYKTGASHYFWMIDDVSLLVPFDNELAMKKVYSGDVVEDWDFYSIPKSQIAPMNLGFVFSNEGDNPQYDIPLTVEVILQGGGVVFSENINVNLGVNESSNIWVKNFTPDPEVLGTYTIIGKFPDDDNNFNNRDSIRFEVTEHVMGHTHPQIVYTIGRNDNRELGLGNIYVLNEDQVGHGVNVMFAANTSNNLKVEINVYEIEFPFTIIDYITTFNYVVPSSAIGGNKWTEIPFPNPIELVAGKMYLLYLYKEENAQRMRISASELGAEDYSAVIYWYSNTSNNSSYFTESGWSPGINLSFDPKFVGVDAANSKPSSRLYQNQPNPFNKTSTIRYELEEATKVTLEIFNVTGQKVMEFNEGRKASGTHSVSIDGSSLPAGIYYYSLTAGDVKATKKMIVLE